MTRPDPFTQQEEATAAGGDPAAEAAARGGDGSPGQPSAPDLQADEAREGRDAASADAGVAPDEPAGAPAAAEEGVVAGDTAPAAADAELDQLRQLAAERDQYLSLAQRAQADFENYRRRMTREAAQAQERGAGRLAKELLPALDHLDLALKAAEAAGGDLFQGVRMVQDEIVAALGRAGIEPFTPQGEPFDPNEHEAMAQRPVEGAEPGTVVEVYQQGYRMNGVILRPARVVVAA